MEREHDDAKGAPRVLLVGKYEQGSAAGDAVSAQRLLQKLTAEGVNVRYASLSKGGLSFSGSGPDVIHALNAEGPATAAREIAKESGAKLVVTTTGTDLNEGANDPVRLAEIEANLRAADRVVTLNETQTQSVREIAPKAAVLRVFQQVELARNLFDFRASLKLPGDAEIGLMLGGLRKVKAQLFAIEGWEACDTTLVIAGDAIESDYEDTIRARAAEIHHIRILPAIPHTHIWAALNAARFLLNTSKSEGESRAILEAFSVGVPVIARRNPGNEALVQHGINGFLIDRPVEIRGAVRQLTDPAVHATLSAGAHEAARVRARAKADHESLAVLYRELSSPDPG